MKSKKQDGKGRDMPIHRPKRESKIALKKLTRESFSQAFAKIKDDSEK